MMAPIRMLRRAYDYSALLAMLHVAALAGLAAYLVTTGALTADKAHEIVKLIRGEAQAEPLPAPATDSASKEIEPKAVVSFEEQQTNLEIMRLEAQRIRAELDQRLALNNSIMLRVTAEREAFQREQQAAQDAKAAAATAHDREGFEKQLAIFENLAPKVAIDHLLQMENPDDAARILMEMDARKAKKIVEAAKRGKPMEAMRGILQRVREIAPARSAEMSSSE